MSFDQTLVQVNQDKSQVYKVDDELADEIGRQLTKLEVSGFIDSQLAYLTISDKLAEYDESCRS